MGVVWWWVWFGGGRHGIWDRLRRVVGGVRMRLGCVGVGKSDC